MSPKATLPRARVVPAAILSAAAVLAAALLFAIAALAQQPAAASAVAARTAANKVALRKLVDAANKLSPEVSKHLSRGLQNYLRYANAAVNGGAPAGNAAAQNFAASKQKRVGWNPWNLIPVSDPALDPATQGYTQNTTSSAWCGSSVVVGYEDSGAYLRTDPNGAFGVPLSFNGVSYSENAGKSFADLGFLTPGTFSANALLGDPVVTCSSATHFQFASILNTTTPDGINPLIGPSISFSTNEGKSWSAPLQAVSLDGNSQLADTPWLAVDSTDTQRLYLSYTEMDALACNSINVVTSADGGKKWSAPVSIDQECIPTDPAAIQNAVTGSRVTVGPDGKVYVTYEFFPGALPSPPQDNEIKFATSTNHGAAFGKPHTIAKLVPSGTGVELNGHLQVTEYPHIAVDRSHSASRGTIYVAYPDGRDKIMADPNSASGIYAYPDIFVAKSTNSGRSFSVLGGISRTQKDFRGIGHDQFLPGVAVDKDGEVAVCYYDRRNDPADLRVDRFCSVSSNQGKTWTDRQVSNLHWLPSLNADPLNPGGGGYTISEYDALTSDFMLHGDGFFGAFIVEISGNQNVVGTKF
jgi:hypothetical protein